MKRNSETPSLHKIYVLVDPVTFEIRYVGATWLPLKVRLSGHIGNKTQIEKRQWILGLKKQGLRPIMELVEFSVLHTEVTEAFWISYYTHFGHSLFNKTKINNNISFNKRKRSLY